MGAFQPVSVWTDKQMLRWIVITQNYILSTSRSEQKESSDCLAWTRMHIAHISMNQGAILDPDAGNIHVFSILASPDQLKRGDLSDWSV